MKRRYLILIVSVFLSLALMLAVGVYVREAVLRPLGLQGESDPATLSLRLLGDGELRRTVLNAIKDGKT